MFAECPDTIIAARSGSPLVIGVGKDEYFLASDASPLIGYTKEVVYLSDNEVAVLKPDGLKIDHRQTGNVRPSIQTLDQVTADIDLGGFEHYMLKEIYEQPQTIENAMRGRLDPEEATSVIGGLNLSAKELRKIDRIVLTACGTSWHAGLVGEYLLEEFARMPTEVEYASELRYRNPPISDRTLIFAITQSGETADTLAAMKECKRKGHPTLASVTWWAQRSLAKRMAGFICMLAPRSGGINEGIHEPGHRSDTPGIVLRRMRHMSYPAGRRIIRQLREMPEKIQKTLECHDKVREIADKYYHFNNYLYLGRLNNFPVALEGALKLKEISYIHAEGYPAAEMKHGPIALVDQQTPSVFVIPRGGIYPKVMSNMEEIKARRGPVIAVACEGDKDVARIADDVIYVPDVEDYLQPLVCAIPHQLLAYHVALLRGCNVDRPRNLAKSVTVE